MSSHVSPRTPYCLGAHVDIQSRHPYLASSADVMVELHAIAVESLSVRLVALVRSLLSKIREFEKFVTSWQNTQRFINHRSQWLAGKSDIITASTFTPDRSI